MISNARAVVAATMLLAGLASPASAEVRNFELSSDLSRCTSAAVSTAESDRLVVVLAAPAGAALSEWALTFTAKDGTSKTEALTGAGPFEVRVERATMNTTAVVSLKGRAAGSVVTCPGFVPERDAGGAVAADPRAPADVSLDGQARVWYASPDGRAAAEKLKNELASRLGLKAVELLPHLPSGAAASPYPASVAETTDLQLALIIDINDTRLRVPQVSDVVCPERDGFRIKDDLSALIGAKQAAVAQPRPEFHLLPIEPLLECGAGDVTYQLQMTVDGTAAGERVKAGLRIRPIYQLAATAAVGFDTARPPSYVVEDAKVAARRSRLGPQLYVGFIWYPTGIDYDRVTTANRVAPFVFFDPSAIRDHLIVGGALTARGRISVPIGLSIHRVLVPDGTQVGAAFEGDGEVKTRRDWDKRGLGLFIGVSFNVSDFLRVKNAASAKK
jgi:hypothetical protein